MPGAKRGFTVQPEQRKEQTPIQDYPAFATANNFLHGQHVWTSLEESSKAMPLSSGRIRRAGQHPAQEDTATASP